MMGTSPRAWLPHCRLSALSYPLDWPACTRTWTPRHHPAVAGRGRAMPRGSPSRRAALRARAEVLDVGCGRLRSVFHLFIGYPTGFFPISCLPLGAAATFVKNACPGNSWDGSGPFTSDQRRHRATESRPITHSVAPVSTGNVQGSSLSRTRRNTCPSSPVTTSLKNFLRSAARVR
jgi:hypothetical protein